jgi:hypothetical protein
MAIEKMIEWLNETLVSARKCFSREATFKWFVVLILGFMIWQEHIGVSSFIRELVINPRHYESMLHFFRSNAWQLKTLQEWWIQIVLLSGVIYNVEGMPVLVGDGTMKNKFGLKMPCVKRLSQESGNASRHTFFGHMFGAIGVLAGNIDKLFCIPLSVMLHGGDYQIKQWSDTGAIDESHVVRTIRDAFRVADSLKIKSIILLDRYYLTKPALITWLEETKRAGTQMLSIVTRAKVNFTAYTEPTPNLRGRPRKKGATVKLNDIFLLFGHKFIKKSVVFYGKEEKISYYSIDLLWGTTLYQKLRFVIICGISKEPTILVSTDLNLTPIKIMELYGFRFKIECCFRELKHSIAGFAYRFWSHAMPKLDRYAKSGTDPLAEVTSDDDKKFISAAFNAIQGFVMIGCIAQGLLQIGALLFYESINASPIRWLRTRTNIVPSEATTADFVRKSLFSMFRFLPVLPIVQIIRQFQKSPWDSLDSEDLSGA